MDLRIDSEKSLQKPFAFFIAPEANMTLTDLGTKILQKSLQVHDEISVGKKEGVL